MNKEINSKLIAYQKRTAIFGKQIQLAHKRAIETVHTGDVGNAEKVAQLGLVIDAMGATTMIIQNYLMQGEKTVKVEI